MNERRQYTLDEFKIEKDRSEINTKMINNKLYRKTTFQDMQLTTNENTEANNLIGDSGNYFRDFVTMVTTLEDVKAARDQIREIPEVTMATRGIYTYID